METLHRKKMKRHEVIDGMRFLTFSCYKRLPLLDNPKIRDLFATRLEEKRAKNAVRIRAWVIMPEHLHLLVRPARGEATLVEALWSLKRDFAREVIGRWRALDARILHDIKTPKGKYRYWQRGGGFDRNIWSDDELYEKLRYIHRNPVKRELVSDPLDWPWSSAHWYAGDHSGPVNIDAPRQPEGPITRRAPSPPANTLPANAAQ